MTRADLKAIQAELHHVADGVAEEQIQHVQDRAHAGTRRGRRVRIAGTLVGALGVLAIAAGLVATGLFGASTADSTTTEAGGVPTAPTSPNVEGRSLLPTKPGEPCPLAERVDLPDLVSSSHLPVWMPHHELAAPATLTGSWLCGAGQVPTLTFGPVMVQFEGGNSPDISSLAKLAEESGTTPTTVNGVPAVELPGPASGSNEVIMVLPTGEYIRIYGPSSMPTATLLAIARTIDVNDPLK